MPRLAKGNIEVDYADDGSGPPVILIHSSVSANRQWRALTGALTDRYRVQALNLFGHGEATAWPAATLQSLYAQAQLVVALCEALDRPVHLVGHSFGGSVALKVAELLGTGVDRMVLLEPNPFHLLQQAGRADAYREAGALRDHVKCFGALGDRARVAERFADYWLGDGSWAAMPDKRRTAFAESLPPNFHGWDAVMGEHAAIDARGRSPAKTLVVSDRTTRRPIRAIVDLFAAGCPHGSFRTIAEGGHMAPLARPDLVNRIVREFLDAG